MRTVKLSKFSGVVNTVNPERMSVEDGRLHTLTDLLTANNVELDEEGKPYRRLGKTAIDATSSHSLWANDELAYVVRGGTLRQINPDMSITDLGVSIAGSRVAYQRVTNDVFFSDGVASGIVGTNGYRPWGIVPPKPTVALIAGELVAGAYLVTTTYIRRNGLESGASPVVSHTSNGAQGIQVTMPASNDPLYERWRVYVSDPNGEVAYLVATMSLADSVANITQLPAERTLTPRTLRCGPMPAGQVIGYYKGRVYVAKNNELWYSLPYEFELTHRAMNFIGHTSPIKTFAACSDGIYIGTDDETVFLQGDEPSKFSRKVVAPYGTVLGSEIVIPPHKFGKGDNPTPAAVWMSKQGLCAGLDGGQFMNLTGDRFALPEGVATGASLLKLRGASPQLVTTLFS